MHATLNRGVFKCASPCCGRRSAGSLAHPATATQQLLPLPCTPLDRHHNAYMPQSFSHGALCAGAGVSGDACSLWSHRRHAWGCQCVQGRRPRGCGRPGRHGHHVRLWPHFCQQHQWSLALSKRLRHAWSQMSQMMAVQTTPAPLQAMAGILSERTWAAHVHSSCKSTACCQQWHTPYPAILSALFLIVCRSDLQNASRLACLLIRHSRSVSLLALVAELHSVMLLINAVYTAYIPLKVAALSSLFQFWWEALWTSSASYVSHTYLWCSFCWFRCKLCLMCCTLSGACSQSVLVSLGWRQQDGI